MGVYPEWSDHSYQEPLEISKATEGLHARYDRPTMGWNAQGSSAYQISDEPARNLQELGWIDPITQ